MTQGRRADERLQQGAGVDGADDGPILRRGHGHMIGRQIAPRPRHVRDDDGRVAGDMIAHVARDEARVGVVAAPRRSADHDIDLLAPVELRHRVLRAGEPGRDGCKRGEAKTGKPHGYPPVQFNWIAFLIFSVISLGAA